MWNEEFFGVREMVSSRACVSLCNGGRREAAQGWEVLLDQGGLTKCCHTFPVKRLPGDANSLCSKDPSVYSLFTSQKTFLYRHCFQWWLGFESGPTEPLEAIDPMICRVDTVLYTYTHTYTHSHTHPFSCNLPVADRGPLWSWNATWFYSYLMISSQTTASCCCF